MIPSSIVVHHSAGPDYELEDWPAIRRYHKRVRGWRDIGYHYGIERLGKIYILRIGRPPHTQGAHVKGNNSGRLGVCLVGNFMQAPPPPGQIGKAVTLVACLCRAWDIPINEVYGHRELASTACPGDAFDLDLFRASMVRELER